MGEGRRRHPEVDLLRLGSVQRRPQEAQEDHRCPPRELALNRGHAQRHTDEIHRDTTMSWGHSWGNMPSTLTPPTYTPTHGTGIGKSQGKRRAQTKVPYPQLVQPHLQPAERTTWVLTHVYTIKMKKGEVFEDHLETDACDYLPYPGR